MKTLTELVQESFAVVTSRDSEKVKDIRLRLFAKGINILDIFIEVFTESDEIKCITEEDKKNIENVMIEVIYDYMILIYDRVEFMTEGDTPDVCSSFKNSMMTLPNKVMTDLYLAPLTAEEALEIDLAKKKEAVKEKLDETLGLAKESNLLVLRAECNRNPYANLDAFDLFKIGVKRATSPKAMSDLVEIASDTAKRTVESLARNIVKGQATERGIMRDQAEAIIITLSNTLIKVTDELLATFCTEIFCELGGDDDIYSEFTKGGLPAIIRLILVRGDTKDIAKMRDMCDLYINIVVDELLKALISMGAHMDKRTLDSHIKDCFKYLSMQLSFDLGIVLTPKDRHRCVVKDDLADEVRVLKMLNPEKYSVELFGNMISMLSKKTKTRERRIVSIRDVMRRATITSQNKSIRAISFKFKQLFKKSKAMIESIEEDISIMEEQAVNESIKAINETMK